MTDGHDAPATPAPTTAYDPLTDHLPFVHVGDRTDDDLRYLTRFRGPDRPYAFVAVPGVDGPRTTLCAPSLFADQARREFPGDQVETATTGRPAGERAAAVLTDAGVGDRLSDVEGDVSDIEGDVSDIEGDVSDIELHVPSQIPHEAVAYLQRAGFEVTATTAVGEARCRKTETEIDCHRRVQRAAALGLARAETVLAEAVADGDELRWDGRPLTTERLRRQAESVLAAAGVAPAGNSVIGAGETAADLHYVGDDRIRPSETVLIDLSPRGPAGYYADITRTFVVSSDGGWDRRAYVACEAAREAALAELADGAGVAAATVHEEAAAELAAHGFRIDSDTVGFTHSTGHGVGLSLHEPPSLSGDAVLAAGDVITVEPGVYDPEEGGVRLEDLVVVREDGYELLQPYPFGSTPRVRELE
ncbi:M24 family metallopeptidase [Halobaculum sp. MBLA0143]|uniref:M24 family metallopeptidase n=1 Tax=Halobaculum sp. MBLA0143 TaxID=3079933 RepID=UPI0035242A67